MSEPVRDPAPTPHDERSSASDALATQGEPGWPRWAWAAAGLVVLGGWALILNRCRRNYSLFTDEVKLARNLLDRSYDGLHLALDQGQVAPLGLLYAGEWVLETVGFSEFGLRALPLAAALASLPLLAVWLRRFVTPWPALAVLVLAGTCADVVLYANQYKQYTLELLATLVIVVLADACFHKPAWGRWAALAAACSLSVWFALASVFVTAGVGLVLLAHAVIVDRGRLVRAGVCGAVTAAGLASAYVLHVRHARGDDDLMGHMEGYWETGFVRGLPSAVDAGIALFRKPGSLELPGLAFGLACVGAVVLVARFRWRGGVVLGPAVVALVASAAGAYPLQDRLAIYLLPVLWLAVGLGLMQVASLRPRRWSGLTAVVLGLVLTAPMVERRGRSPVEDLMPVVDRARAQIEPGDTVYLYYGATPLHDFYAAVQPDRALPEADLVRGVRARGDWPAYGEELAAVAASRPGRAWVVFGHVYEWADVDERLLMLMYLDRLGERRETIEGQGAWAYLYKLDP